MAARFDVQAFANAWNTQQIDRILEFYADDAEMVVLPDTEPYRGKDGVRANLEEVFRGLGDLNGDVIQQVQTGDRAAVLVEVSGRHTGPMTVSEDRVLDATDREVRFTVAIFLELDGNGKIRREVDVADNLTLLQQVGALEAPTGARQAGRAR